VGRFLRCTSTNFVAEQGVLVCLLGGIRSGAVFVVVAALVGWFTCLVPSAKAVPAAIHFTFSSISAKNIKPIFANPAMP
jgi:hypothetical protein